MSAPSKEEIARFISESREWMKWEGPWPRSRSKIFDSVIVAIADENERLTNALKSMQIDRDRLALENERLRAENDKLMADALVRQTTEIKLRAERAECLALIERYAFMDMLPSIDDDAADLLAKLRGQQS